MRLRRLRSLLGCQVSAAWKAVLHLQGGACRRDAPCWRVSYSERQQKKKTLTYVDYWCRTC